MVPPKISPFSGGRTTELGGPREIAGTWLSAAGGCGTLMHVKSPGGEELKQAVDDLARASRKARRRGRARDWHKLRTGSRRLRGALLAHAGLLDRSVQEKLSRRVKKITKLPAEVRDLDVALQNLSLLRDQAESAPERKAAKKLRRRLERQRDRQDRHLRRHLERKRPVRALARKLKKALAHAGVESPDHARAAQALQDCAREVLQRRDGIGDWDDDQSLHALRVSVKKLRGALLARDAGPRRAERPLLTLLEDTQRLLGEHHDWSELGDRLDLRRCKLLAAGARHRGLIGYELLLSRAREEQKARYDGYRTQLHDRLAAAVSELLPERAPRGMVVAVPAGQEPAVSPAAAVH
jgi:CHAD domain-containing protein